MEEIDWNVVREPHSGSEMGWWGFDLDGTLAFFDEGAEMDPSEIGEPIPEIVEVVREKHLEGYEVKIFTARMADTEGTSVGVSKESIAKMIAEWTAKHIGIRMSATAVKDWRCRGFYDDRAVSVVSNTGFIRELPYEVAVDMVNDQKEKTDSAYEERNLCVLLAVKLARRAGVRCWLEYDAQEGWDDSWRVVVYVGMPEGQMSWHLHNSEVPEFERLLGPVQYPEKTSWDGHTTEEKYGLIRRL